MTKKNLKGTWAQAIWSVCWPLLIILSVRWALLEPYVIPSGSMIPNLLIHDHIFVQKFSYGLRVPFSQKWLIQWGTPNHGDIIVFRYPHSPTVFYIKRLIGIPGDRIRVTRGRIEINGEPLELKESPPPKGLESDGANYSYFLESGPQFESHLIRFLGDQDNLRKDESREWVVPAGKYFFMGDNRDESNDSRSWGFVSEEHLIGKTWIIWFSCEDMLSSAPFLCDPSTLRWNRIFSQVAP